MRWDRDTETRDLGPACGCRRDYLAVELGEECACPVEPRVDVAMETGVELGTAALSRASGLAQLRVDPVAAQAQLVALLEAEAGQRKRPGSYRSCLGMAPLPRVELA